MPAMPSLLSLICTKLGSPGTALVALELTTRVVGGESCVIPTPTAHKGLLSGNQLPEPSRSSDKQPLLDRSKGPRSSKETVLINQPTAER